MRFPVLDRSDAEGLGRDDPGARAAAALRGRRQRRRRRRGAARRAPLDGLVLGRRRATPSQLLLDRAAANGAVGEVLDGVRAGPGARRVEELVTLFGARGTEVGGGRRAGRRAARGRGRRHRHLRPDAQHQLHEPVHVQVPVLRVRQGPAEPEPARQAVPADRRGDRRAGARGVGRRARPRCACRAASTRPSTATTTRGRARRARGGAGHPHPRLHRARGHRGRAAARRAAGDLPAADEGRGPALAAGHRGRDPRRPGAGDPVPGQDQHRASGSRRTGPPTAIGLRSNVTIMFGAVEQPRLLGAPPPAHARPAEARPAASPSSCRCRSCTWRRRSTSSSQSRARPDVPRDGADARGRPGSPTTA